MTEISITLESLKSSDLRYFKPGSSGVRFSPDGNAVVRVATAQELEAVGVSCSVGHHEQQNYAWRVAVTRSVLEIHSERAALIVGTRCPMTSDGFILPWAGIGVSWTVLPFGSYMLSDCTVVEATCKGIAIRNARSASRVWVV